MKEGVGRAPLHKGKVLASVSDCHVIEVSVTSCLQGNAARVVQGEFAPFSVQRVFYLYDIPSGESRGAHAHIECHQFLVAASGSFEVLLDDGRDKSIIRLSRPNMGLHIPPGIWASEINFAAGSTCLVLASHLYAEDDYIRRYEDFLRYRKES